MVHVCFFCSYTLKKEKHNPTQIAPLGAINYFARVRIPEPSHGVRFLYFIFSRVLGKVSLDILLIYFAKHLLFCSTVALPSSNCNTLTVL